jgi:hypothetical protein
MIRLIASLAIAALWPVHAMSAAAAPNFAAHPWIDYEVFAGNLRYRIDDGADVGLFHVQGHGVGTGNGGHRQDQHESQQACRQVR